MNAHELGFTTFLAEPSQRRLRTLFELGEKRRKDIRALMDHSLQLDARYCEHLSGKDASAGAVEARLRSLGAPGRCFVISGDEVLDGKETPLREALEGLSGGFFGGFVSSIPGKLGYFEYEEMKSAYLLRK